MKMNTIKSIVTWGMALALFTSVASPLTVEAAYPDVEVSDSADTPTAGSNTNAYKTEVTATVNITSDMLGGDLILSIPDSISLRYSSQDDGTRGGDAGSVIFVSDELYVGINGNINPCKQLKVALESDMTFAHKDDASTTVPGIVSAFKTEWDERYYAVNDFTYEIVNKNSTVLYSAMLHEYGADTATWTDTDMTATPKTADAFVATWSAEEVYDIQHSASTDWNDKALQFFVDAKNVKFVGEYEGIVNFYVSTPTIYS